MHKDDLWCGYCGTQEFEEVPDSRYSTWRCLNCLAEYQNNPGYGYFTTFWGNNSPDTLGRFCLNSGEVDDETKLPRTPEGIVRHSGSREELKSYLTRTQIK